MAANLVLYKKSLSAIGDYFNVSELCAGYLYHRSFRSRRKDDKYLPWNIQLQNAIVKADKCLGMEWGNVQFGQEEKEFSQHGIHMDEMLNVVFRWKIDTSDINLDGSNSEWIVVKKKKSKKDNVNLNLVKRPGLII